MSKFFWVGDLKALDLANTLAADRDGRELELLVTFDDLLEWLVESGTVNESGAARVSRALDSDSKRKMVELARDLRRTLKDMARSLAHDRPVPRSVVKAINAVIKEKEGHFELVQTSRGFENKFQANVNSVTDFLLPIAESAINLLCYQDHSRVKKCEGGGCVLYFYDNSVSRNRRWCSMSACGNRAKVNAHYKRAKRA